MIAELGHYALVLALAVALVQASVPIVGARRNDPVLMSVAGPTAVAQFCFIAMADDMLRAVGFFRRQRVRELPLRKTADLQDQRGVGEP